MDVLGQVFALIFFLFACNHIQLLLLTSLGDVYGQHLGFRLWLPFVVLGLCFIVCVQRKWIAISIAYFSFYLILLIDQLYFSFFGTMPVVGGKIPLTQGLDIADSILALLRPVHLFGVVYFFALLIFGIWYYRHQREKQRAFKRFLIGRLMGVGMLLAGLICVVAGAITPIPEKTYEFWKPLKKLPFEHWGARYSVVDYTRVFGAPIYHVKDIATYFNQEQPAPLSPGEMALSKQHFEALRKADGQGPLFGAAKNANVVVLQLESFQFWLVGKKIDGVEITPFLNRLYREQLHWNNIYDVTGLGRTADAEFAFNTGMLPNPEKASCFNDFAKDLFTFPRTLREDGYQTASFHGYKPDFWNRTNTHPFFGIDKMMFIESYPKTPNLGLGIPDKEILPHVADYLATTQNPYFAFIITLSCHYPYHEVPSEELDNFKSLDNDPALIYLPGYIRLAHYTDQALERFFQDMERKHQLDNTIVALFGDHDFNSIGISLEAMISFTNAASKVLGTNPMAVNEDKVPLVIWLPEKLRAAVPDPNAYETVPGTLCDVFPSIFHLLGQPVPPGVLGSHLFAPDRDAFPLPRFFDTTTWSVGYRIYDKNGLYYLRGNTSQLFDSKGSAVTTVGTPFALVRDANRLARINERIVETNQQSLFRQQAQSQPSQTP